MYAFLQQVGGSLDVISVGCFESECLAVQFNNSISSRTESDGSSDSGKAISLMN